MNLWVKIMKFILKIIILVNFAMEAMRNKIMEKVKRIQELRRSNAATPLRNKKKYTRKEKYKNRLDN